MPRKDCQLTKLFKIAKIDYLKGGVYEKALSDLNFFDILVNFCPIGR